MNLRQLISFFSAILLGLSSVSATIPEHLGGKGTQVEGVVLLSEDGTPRCRIGKLPSEDLGIGLDNLDALEECDESDELYAHTILESEEINLGMAAPPGFIKGAEFVWEAGRLAIPMLAIGFLAGCLPTLLPRITGVEINKNENDAKEAGTKIMIFAIATGGILGSAIFIKATAVNELMAIVLGISGVFSAGSGIVACDDKSSKRGGISEINFEEESEPIARELEISEIEREILTITDQLCGDVWCAGNYDFDFHRVTCYTRTAPVICRFAFDMNSHPWYPASVSCEISISAPLPKRGEDIWDYYDRFIYEDLSDCIDDLADKLKEQR